MNHFKKAFCFLFLFLFSFSIFGQEDKPLLNLDRIFKNYEFFGERFGPARWIDEGKYYTTLETSKDVTSGRDIVKYETKTGNREVMVSAKLLIPPGNDKPLTISDYVWSPSKKLLLIFTNTARVWRYNTKGDYWVLNLETNELKKLGGDAKPSTLMFAKFSPDNKKVAYVREHNVYVENIVDGKITQLTFDGSETIINGTFDWVYEEEFDCRDGFRWSPDSKQIAYWQLDASGIGVHFMINNTDSLYAKIIPVQYPKVGTQNSSCKVGVINAEGGETVWMKVSGDPRNNYIPRMDWHDSSAEIWFQYFNRAQTKLEIYLGNPKTGEVKPILKEEDNVWIDVVDDMRWLNKGKEFTWISERDGWRHIYLISKDGQKVTLLTQGNFDVVDIQKIDDKNGWIYYRASPENATQRYLFRVSMDGKNKIEKLTPQEFAGTNNYQISDGAKFAIHTYTNANTPATIELIELPSHKKVKTLVDNKTYKEKINQLKRLPVEFFQIDIGSNITLDGWMIKPYNFDSAKKYPVLYYLYGEPAAQTVLDQFFGTQYLWHLMLAQQGYIVISVDNRGTPAPKGKEFRKSLYKKVGTVTSQDQAEAMKAMLKKYSFLDPLRLAVWGWSGGGVSTLNLMFRYPDIFHTGLAVAAVSDERLYDTIYSERYMGLITDNEEGYKESAAVTYAGQLKGNLLMVHGTGDDNVHYQNVDLLINELVKQNKHFTMMAYPNRSHGIYEGEGTTIHLYTLLTKYLNDNTPAGGR
jgi:dipeptidyl-peptidase-4